MTIQRSTWHAASILAMTGLAAASAAADDKGACVASYERSQALRREGKLQRAREELRLCSRAACPALVRNDCVVWLEQVQVSYPSIAVRAEKDGADMANVRVVEDGEVVASRLDGKALDVEPGEHTFRFEADGAPPITLTLVVHEGEKNRVVAVRFESPRRAEATPATSGGGRDEALGRPIPAGVYVLGGVGLLGLTGFAVLGGIGKSDESSLHDSCSPNCAKSDIDAVRGKYLAADISLGVGVASLGAAVVWYLLRPSHAETPVSLSGVDISPTRGGATLAWSRVF